MPSWNDGSSSMMRTVARPSAAWISTSSCPRARVIVGTIVSHPPTAESEGGGKTLHGEQDLLAQLFGGPRVDDGEIVALGAQLGAPAAAPLALDEELADPDDDVAVAQLALVHRADHRVTSMLADR